MRAVWLPNLTKESDYRLNGEAHHHLINVVRVEMGEEVLLLDGKGLSVKTTIMGVSKREIHLSTVETKEAQRTYEIDLALGIPKREALELCLKEATELGFRKIFLIRSEFSQIKVPEKERLEKVLVSALEQSNAPYLPELKECQWGALPWDEYPGVVLLDSQTPVEPKTQSKEGPSLMIVGPEGGFSPTELIFFHSRGNLEVLNLPTPILRSPTAVAAGAGVLLQRLIDRK